MKKFINDLNAIIFVIIILTTFVPSNIILSSVALSPTFEKSIPLNIDLVVNSSQSIDYGNKTFIVINGKLALKDWENNSLEYTNIENAGWITLYKDIVLVSVLDNNCTSFFHIT